MAGTGSSAVVGCLRGSSILITGSTGYLGKLLVEKILRVGPEVKKLYLVVRAPDAASAERRVLNEIVSKDLFNPLREKHGLAGFQDFIKEKLVPLAGDTRRENFGLESSQVKQLSEEIDIIINGAATTSFYERYDVALASNTLGSKYACEFAKKCANLKMLLHVSTAFVAGTQDGLLLEKPFKIGQTLKQGCSSLDIEAELQLVDKVKSELMSSSDKSEKTTMKELGLNRANHFGWPNVYTFTKAMGEMLLGHIRGDLPVVIIRPSIVTSTYQDPFPGWIEGIRTIDALVTAYDEQAFPCFIGDRDDILDAIPADMVINAMLVAMSARWKEAEQSIYHVNSALRNPLTGHVIMDACWDYFSVHPRRKESGEAIQTKKPRLFKRFVFFRAYLILLYKLPLEMLHAVNLLFCGLFSQHYNRLNRSYNFLMLLVKIYAPYSFFKGCFDDTNLARLRVSAETNNPEDFAFNFDPGCIDWYSYFFNIHVPAVLKCSRKKRGKSGGNKLA